MTRWDYADDKLVFLRSGLLNLGMDFGSGIALKISRGFDSKLTERWKEVKGEDHTSMNGLRWFGFEFVVDQNSRMDEEWYWIKGRVNEPTRIS